MPGRGRRGGIGRMMAKYILGRGAGNLMCVGGEGTDKDEQLSKNFTVVNRSGTKVILRTIDISEDAYGAAILALVRDLPQILHPSNKEQLELSLWNCTFAVLLLLVNLVLQSSILAYVYHYVVSLDVANVQKRYKDFRLHVFNASGVIEPDLWNNYEGRFQVCQIAMWNRPFYYSILFCWCLVMMIEIKKSEEFIRHVFWVPLCDNPLSMLLRKGESKYVVAFTRWTRFWIIVLVGIPRALISLILLWLGCEWLSATIQFEDLVMNTVAMGFIVNIDEILFHAVLPRFHRLDVENIDFLMERHALTEAEARAKMRKSYRKSCTYMALLLAFIVFYAEYMQDVLPPDISKLRGKCQELLGSSSQPVCTGTTWYLRGKAEARSRACFPLPVESEADALDEAMIRPV